MKLFILKTNIATSSMVRAIRSLFIFNPSIMDWSIDMEDIDKVLRIEVKDNINEREIIHLVRTCGAACEPLSD